MSMEDLSECDLSHDVQKKYGERLIQNINAYLAQHGLHRLTPNAAGKATNNNDGGSVNGRVIGHATNRGRTPSSVEPPIVHTTNESSVSDPVSFEGITSPEL